MPFGRTSTLTKPEVFRRLADLGITKAIVHYSGGNDDGGVDSITAVDADGNKLDIDLNIHVWDGEVSSWDAVNGYTRRPATPQEVEFEQLRDALEEPIYARFYTFAGDFYVSGEVVWDGTTGKVTMSGEERVDHYDEFEVEL